jgi:hypothetical protein
MFINRLLRQKFEMSKFALYSTKAEREAKNCNESPKKTVDFAFSGPSVNMAAHDSDLRWG